MLVTKSNQVLAIDIEDIEQVLEGEGLVNTFRTALKNIERTAPGIDGEFMLVKSIHLFSQSVFVCGMCLQQDSIWIFSDQLRLKLIFWLEIINSKELGICDFFVCIGDVEFLTVFTSDEVGFDLLFSLDHI